MLSASVSIASDVQWIAGCLTLVLQPARSHGPIRFMLTSLPANLIGPCDLGGWSTSVKQPATHCSYFLAAYKNMAIPLQRRDSYGTELSFTL